MLVLKGDVERELLKLVKELVEFPNILSSFVKQFIKKEKTMESCND